MIDRAGEPKSENSPGTKAAIRAMARSPRWQRAPWLLVLGNSAESSTGLIVTMADGTFAKSSPVNGEYPGNIDPVEHHSRPVKEQGPH